MERSFDDSNIPSTSVPRWNRLSNVSKRSQPRALLRFSWRLWRNPGRFGISQSCGRIGPSEAVFTPQRASLLSLSAKAVDDHNPSTVRENKEIVCFFEGRFSGSKT
jgi:hypothetical protein